MPPFRRIAVLTIALVLSACGGKSLPDAGNVFAPDSVIRRASSATVTIVSEAYWPARLKVKAGAAVRFLDKDSLTHTVTANDGSFGSSFLTKGHAWRHTFSTAGKYRYHCKIHPFMHGLIIVTK